MSTVELELVRREAKEEEKEEIERIRRKYKERQNQRQLPNTAEQEKQALMEQALKQELQEKEQRKQKYKQRKQNGQLTTQTTNNTEKQKLIQQAQQQEQQEKEQIKQKLKQRRKNVTTETLTTETPPETDDLYKKALGIDVADDEDIWDRYLIQKHDQDVESLNQVKEVYDDEFEIDEFESEDLKMEELESEDWEIGEPENDDLEIAELESDDLDINNFESNYSDTSEFESDYGNFVEIESDDLEIDKLEGEGEELKTVETVDRSDLLAKYNIQDVQVDDVDHLLENFDRSLTDENVEKVERNIVEKITNSALSHPKIEWVNVLVFLDEETGKGSIKIFAEYVDRGLLKRLISDANTQLEVELMQTALYEVWDVFTTLGVNTDYLESKIEVEVELDRA